MLELVSHSTLQVNHYQRVTITDFFKFKSMVYIPTTQDKQSVVSAFTLTTTILLQKDLQCMILCSLCTTYVPATDNYEVLQTFESQVFTDICTDCALSQLQANLM